MPWPMVHFSIAEKCFDHDPSPEFLLGSIAPDAIHMRANTTRKDKGRTHLCEDDGTMPNLQTFSDFCKRHITHNDHDNDQFILGYVSHLYADLKWTETVWNDYVDKMKPVIDGQNESIKSRYNIEVCQIDYNLYRNEAWSNKIFDSLLKAREYSVPDLLTSKEITQYRAHIMQNLRNEEKEPCIVPIYITDDIVKLFIKDTVDELKSLIKAWKNG
ncbi:zinc dependent phospholipase C family protein [Paenibacillus sp. LjRoot56]|uniref:zinc dependent phospholipase C family protein n=1 Tax=Paenibacillus sp. LjRoot56 TaxID=3342333 RepID=UPI003ED0971C